ncbi:MAG: hypothetical protein ACLRR3_04335 [Eubacterium sp.]
MKKGRQGTLLNVMRRVGLRKMLP